MATADCAWGLPPIVIVVGEFLTDRNGAPAEQEDVTADDARLKVRVARVVDTFGAAATNATIHIPVATQAKHAARHAAVAFEDLPDPFFQSRATEKRSGVFHHLASRRNPLRREDAQSLDGRSANEEAKC
jgi:hypothetical protein